MKKIIRYDLCSLTIDAKNKATSTLFEEKLLLAIIGRKKKANIITSENSGTQNAIEVSIMLAEPKCSYIDTKLDVESEWRNKQPGHVRDIS